MKVHYTEKCLKFFSAPLRIGKIALHCVGHKEILGWITTGGSKIYMNNFDSGRTGENTR